MNLPNGYLLQNGKYRLTQLVGQGGFGFTYKGVWFTQVKGPLGAMNTEVPICVKEYFFKDYCYRDKKNNTVKVHSATGLSLFDKFKEKLIKEASLLSELNHSHIVNVLEVFEENDTAYIVMEYVAGCSLKYMLEKKGVLPEKKVLRYVSQIGEALQFVHENHILHLDIKPSNIIINQSDQVKLIDFGVSKRYDTEQQETSTTLLTLSKGFASIEQYDSEGISNFSPCPDVYSLGATMYNLLTGKIPTESILRATKDLLSPITLNPSISKKTNDAILKAMEIIPANRFQSIKEFMDHLDLPSEDGEPSENTLFEYGRYSEVEEETIYKGEDRNSSSEELLDTEETQLEMPRSDLNLRRKKKTSKKIVLYSSFLIVIVFLGGWYFKSSFFNKTNSDLMLSGKEEGTETSLLTENKKEIATGDSLGVKKDSLILDTETASQKNMIAEAKPKIIGKETLEKKKNQDINKKKEEQLEEKTKEDPKAEQLRYDSLIVLGKQKMGEANYATARNLFGEALSIKNTEEIVRLQKNCETQEEILKIALAKSKYEEKMPFGDFMIVRKKSNHRYGAINKNGNETIPCIYLNVGIATNGRAFEREDHLFDIYNSKGEVIGSGLSFY